MTTLTRRSAFAAFAAAFIAPVVASRVAHAQGATNAPAGGIPSTTAPSNSQGTPAGGTGIISTTRVPAAGGAPAPATAGTPLVGGAPGTSETTTPVAPRRHRHRRARHHHTTTTPSTSQ